MRPCGMGASIICSSTRSTICAWQRQHMGAPLCSGVLKDISRETCFRSLVIAPERSCSTSPLSKDTCPASSSCASVLRSGNTCTYCGLRLYATVWVKVPSIENQTLCTHREWTNGGRRAKKDDVTTCALGTGSSVARGHMTKIRRSRQASANGDWRQCQCTDERRGLPHPNNIRSVLLPNSCRVCSW